MSDKVRYAVHRDPCFQEDAGVPYHYATFDTAEEAHKLLASLTLDGFWKIHDFTITEMREVSLDR